MRNYNVTFTLQKVIYLGSSLEPIDAKINGFVGYEDRTEARVVAAALAWRREISEAGFLSIDAFPGDGGEICVSGIQGSYTFEVIIENDMSNTFSFSLLDSYLARGSNTTSDAALRALKEAAAILWTLSGGLKRINMTLAKSGLTELRLGSPPALTAACL